MLYNQTIKSSNKNFDISPLADLYAVKTNRKLFGLPINHLVWMHHVGEKKYNQQKFIDKKAKVEKAYTKKLKKAGSQKSQTNLQYRRSKKIEALDKKWEGALPYTLFIAPGGKILYAKQGIIDPLALKKLIADSVGRIY